MERGSIRGDVEVRVGGLDHVVAVRGGHLCFSVSFIHRGVLGERHCCVGYTEDRPHGEQPHAHYGDDHAPVEDHLLVAQLVLQRPLHDLGEADVAIPVHVVGAQAVGDLLGQVLEVDHSVRHGAQSHRLLAQAGGLGAGPIRASCFGPPLQRSHLVEGLDRGLVNTPHVRIIEFFLLVAPRRGRERLVLLGILFHLDPDPRDWKAENVVKFDGVLQL
mmetsp:Transcript_15413/g.33647  ORF Transcript_15413/g.33647 Transcript_15413/m.33647 type:complete len:217 (-) Transcript_15413:121-771(-)